LIDQNQNIQFKLNSELIGHVQGLIGIKDDQSIKKLFNDFHYADIAEILNELNFEESIYVIKLLDSKKTSDVLTEIDEDIREKVLDRLSNKEIAEEIEELDTDDAADIIAELPVERQEDVISKIEDEEHKAEIKELLNYDEDSAGGLMAKELVKVYETWTVAGCLRKIRAQAENVTRVHSIYVVTKKEELIGRLSLKDLIIAKSDQKIADIYISNVDYANVKDDVEDVAKIMTKYDLEAIPVTDDNRILLGRITIDDIVDVIKEEADKDYQLAAGISQDVEADDSVFELTKARLPWLVLGLFGGLGSVFIMRGFDHIMESVPELFFYTPLIAAMAGNVGVQSSAIIVQGLANNNVKGSLFFRLLKEVGLSLINGFTLALLVILFGYIINQELVHSIAIAISMMSVIIVAALIGTFVPIILDKKGIDPAIATGPFITTSNDILGIYLFFIISEFIIGF
jgi:magnesium transporter